VAQRAHETSPVATTSSAGGRWSNGWVNVPAHGLRRSPPGRVVPCRFLDGFRSAWAPGGQPWPPGLDHAPVWPAQLPGSRPPLKLHRVLPLRRRLVAAAGATGPPEAWAFGHQRRGLSVGIGMLFRDQVLRARG